MIKAIQQTASRLRVTGLAARLGELGIERGNTHIQVAEVLGQAGPASSSRKASVRALLATSCKCGDQLREAGRGNEIVLPEKAADWLAFAVYWLTSS